MEIRVLRYFLEVAREENITRAAARLHITQPTLTRQLHQLEAELGKKLYVRGNYNIRLTEEGVLLRERAQEIIDLEEKARSELTAVQDEVSGVIYIGAGETVGIRYIAAVLRRLRERYPNVRYHMISADGDGVAEKLDKGLIDFGIFVGKVGLDKYDHLVLPDVDTWGVLLLKDDPLAEQGFARPEDLLGRPLLFSRQAMAEGELADWLGYPMEQLDIAGAHNLAYNASVMVREGLGAALTIEGIINTTGRSALRFVPLRPEVTARLVLAWRRGALFSQAAAKFLEMARGELDASTTPEPQGQKGDRSHV